MAKIELSPAAKRAKAAYQRAWVSRNKAKQQEYQKRYWERLGMQLVTVTDTDVTDNTAVTTCLNCNKPFSAKRKDAKFCSDSCRVYYNRKKL